MSVCPTCSSQVATGARFCGACGAELLGSSTPTRTHLPSTSAPPDSLPSAGARFVPGTLLAGRYRIVGLLGRGGMGQVYRADDLKLGQPVALKFLPEALARDAGALARFHREVRVARQIAHPSVCRVFDIGEVDGQHYITMEYIDGEDLASLIRRIGRLPAEKALEIARQTCAGLAAAHDLGVLHRDLKPANVMIDGRGRARIADFGLAGLEAEFAGADVASGTPAYMAPEQLAGREVTVRSEVYALGLLLHEIFTGHRVFEASTPAELRRLREQPSQVTPSSFVKDLDPLVERVIQRCLEDDPARRPGSVLQVAAALPGGNPLEEALAAGETPSPEMVAAAPTEGALSRRVAGLCVAAIAITVGLITVGDRINLHHRVPMERSPAVLVDRAVTMLASFGYTERPVGRAWGFERDEHFGDYRGDPILAPARWRRLMKGQPIAYYFWYRQGPLPLQPALPGRFGLKVHLDDPPLSVEGTVALGLDLRGRLVGLQVTPPALSSEAPVDSAFDWTPLFEAAGLDRARFTRAARQWTPPVFADEVAAWSGRFPDHPDLPLRVEAAAYHGRPVHFRVVAPWDVPLSAEPVQDSAPQRAATILFALVIGSIVVTAVLLARRNLNEGRGDRQGALRVALFAFVVALLQTLLVSTPPTTFKGVLALLTLALSGAVFGATTLWLCYLALEPNIRRHRPQLIVSWSRVLAGNFRDPMVGRDALLGVLMGSAIGAAWCLSGWLKEWFGATQYPNSSVDTIAFEGFPGVLGLTLEQVLTAVWGSLAILIFIAMLRPLVRRDAIAGIVLWAALCTMWILFTMRSWPAITYTVIMNAILVLAATRFGLVTGMVTMLMWGLFQGLPFTPDLSLWYSSATIVVLSVTLAISLFGFVVSTGRSSARRRS